MSRRSVDDWQPCPPGELGHLGQRLKRRQQRRNFLRVTGIIGVGLVTSGAAVVGGMFLYDPWHAGITCSRVVELADAYGQGTVDPATAERIRQHLPLCPNCRRYYQSRNLVGHPGGTHDDRQA